MSAHRLRFLAVLAALIAMLATACGGSDNASSEGNGTEVSTGDTPSTEGASPAAGEDGGHDSGDQSLIRIGLAAPSVLLILPIVADEQGYFEAEGLHNVEVSFTPGPQLTPALAGGQFEVAISSAPQPDLVAINGGLIQVAGAWMLSSGQFLVAGPGIDSVADLAGRKVAINGSKASSSGMLMAHALAEEGLTFDDVDLSVLQDAVSQIQAYSSGQVDAMVSFAPFIWNVAEDRPGTTVLRGFEDVTFPVNEIVVNTAWAEANPDRVAKVLRALDKALTAWRDEPDLIKDIIARELKLPDGDPTVDRLYDHTLELFADRVQAIDVATEQALFALLRDNGFAEATDEAASSAVAPQYAEAAFGQ